MPITGRSTLSAYPASAGPPRAQQGSLHLPARGLRQLRRELHDPRVFVRRGLVSDVLLELSRQLLARLKPIAQHDHGAHHRSPLLVRRSYDRRLGDCAVRHKRGLDLEWADPVPGRDDQIIGASFEVEIAVLVLPYPVAGVPCVIFWRGVSAEVTDKEGRIGRGIAE